jgi:hypothetical protein
MEVNADTIILGTGVAPNCAVFPLLADLLKTWPTTVEGGLPEVTQDLRWAEGLNIYATGGLAALQVR